MTPPTERFTIVRSSRSDWQQFRDLRLRMLADTPLAFLETLEGAQQVGDDEWRRRAGGGADNGTAWFVAVDTSTGTWAGIMGGRIENEAPLLIGVFVDPDSRGRDVGVTDALLDAVEDWARERGQQLFLHVHEDNPRAIGFYRRRGFTPTGRRLPYPLPPAGEELELVKSLQ
ncbi:MULTISPECIES: GNAT family N-acetyltransferase [unclassified Curtobacterium]|uniref:GNAT family N-acetyltransferase n=1 Tax=unclassified Curtobacterium TaxID=257496 RepID=UPI000D8F47D1|nr:MULTISPECIES: GNAT family N-acetyltransferase [unclassified Curtobacterium]PYY33632.1 GNAT family N-acetyltransferase [Curtobacterium sp. MCBD17_030]PZE34528.1 GNAT family N-acetyltransferase [Curtobacterium sp. MCPF17_031]PZF11982.1 GNAT family N-acetyltransferase [Curtobacterium sp. MCPF17_011]